MPNRFRQIQLSDLKRIRLQPNILAVAIHLDIPAFPFLQQRYGEYETTNGPT